MSNDVKPYSTLLRLPRHGSQEIVARLIAAQHLHGDRSVRVGHLRRFRGYDMTNLWQYLNNSPPMTSNRLGFINPRLTLVHKKCHLVLVISIGFHILYYLSKVEDGKHGKHVGAT